MLFRFIAFIKISNIVVELIRDTIENSFCRTLESHDSYSITNIYEGIL